MEFVFQSALSSALKVRVKRWPLLPSRNLLKVGLPGKYSQSGTGLSDSCPFLRLGSGNQVTRRR